METRRVTIRILGTEGVGKTSLLSCLANSQQGAEQEARYPAAAASA